MHMNAGPEEMPSNEKKEKNWRRHEYGGVPCIIGVSGARWSWSGMIS